MDTVQVKWTESQGRNIISGDETELLKVLFSGNHLAAVNLI